MFKSSAKLTPSKTGSRLLLPYRSELRSLVSMGLGATAIVAALEAMPSGPFTRNKSPRFIKQSTRIVYVSQAIHEILF